MIIALIILAIFVGLILLGAQSKYMSIDNEAGKAISFLVEKGAAIECNSKHIYFSKTEKKYIILHFDFHGRLKSEHEEKFDKLDDAVSRFIQLANGKLD